MLSVLLLSLSANLDTLVVAASYGLRGRRVTPLNGLLIALITTLATFLALAAGWVLAGALPQALPDLIGGVLLMMMGAWTVVTELFPQRGADTEQEPAGREARPVSLALALAVNNLGIGAAAGIARVSVLWMALFTFGFTLLFLWLGCWVGRRLGGRFSNRLASLCAGLLLLGLGFLQTLRL